MLIKLKQIIYKFYLYKKYKKYLISLIINLVKYLKNKLIIEKIIYENFSILLFNFTNNFIYYIFYM